MADNTNKQRHRKKDPNFAIANTAKNRTKRINRDAKRQANKRAHLIRWAAKHGVRMHAPSKELRLMVRDVRFPNWDYAKVNQRAAAAKTKRDEIARDNARVRAALGLDS